MARKFNLIKRPFPTIDWETAEKWLTEKRAIAAAKVLGSKSYAGICDVCGSEPGYKRADGDIECNRCRAILVEARANAKAERAANDMHRSGIPFGTASLNLVKPHDPESQQLRDILEDDDSWPIDDEITYLLPSHYLYRPLMDGKVYELLRGKDYLPQWEEDLRRELYQTAKFCGMKARTRKTDRGLAFQAYKPT